MVSALMEVCTGCSEAQRKSQGTEVIELKNGIMNGFVGEKGKLEKDCEETVDKIWRMIIVVIDNREKEFKTWSLSRCLE